MVSASCSTGQCAGGVVNRGADADISSAPTDVAIHGEIDVVVARILDFLEKRDCAHHLAGLQYPHCGTSWAIQAFCTAPASRPVTASIVVISALSSAETGIEQERSGLPSINTVQAPH